MKTATSPGSRTRSLDWREIDPGTQARVMLAPGARVYQAAVRDGHLSAIVSIDGGEWHLSVSHRLNVKPFLPGRIPTFEEVKDARYALLPGDVTVAMLFPPADQWVDVHPTTLHLYGPAVKKGDTA